MIVYSFKDGLLLKRAVKRRMSDKNKRVYDKIYKFRRAKAW